MMKCLFKGHWSVLFVGREVGDKDKEEDETYIELDR